MSRKRPAAPLPSLPVALEHSATWKNRTWISYWAVMILFAVNTAANAPADMAIIPVITAGMTFWLLQTLLLWAFFPALKQGHPRRLSWFGYILLIYLPFCIVGALQPPYWSGVLTSTSIVVLFFCNAFWVRALKRAHAARDAAASDNTQTSFSQ